MVSHYRSPEWKITRQIMLEAAGYCCEVCGAAGKKIGGDAILHVHHMTYENFGHESLGDLQVLCKGCHEDEHGKEIGSNYI